MEEVRAARKVRTKIRFMLNNSNGKESPPRKRRTFFAIQNRLDSIVLLDNTDTYTVQNRTVTLFDVRVVGITHSLDGDAIFRNTLRDEVFLNHLGTFLRNHLVELVRTGALVGVCRYEDVGVGILVHVVEDMTELNSLRD